MKNTIILFIALILISCKDDPQVVQPVNEPLPYPYNTAHYSVYYTGYDSSTIRAIGDTLEKHYMRIVNNLNSDTLPLVKIYFYKTYEELAAAVQHVVPNLPPWATALALTEDQIHMLSPSHPQQFYEFMIRTIIHEFAHCVSMHIKPNIANNPRWLWESVALYESGQFTPPNTIPYMVNQQPPTLAQLNSFSNTFVYDVGYLLSEYIILNWSRTHYVNMILTNGNIQSVLGVSPSQFEANWFQFVKNRYGI